mmetsp:Transcript_23797/g.64125  ORF Transcript_23797/g.64125 Transcript_23797/m.64125 type:complete len:285 (+) Transcript_23797:583-1437(+)
MKNPGSHPCPVCREHEQSTALVSPPPLPSPLSKIKQESPRQRPPFSEHDNSPPTAGQLVVEYQEALSPVYISPPTSLRSVWSSSVRSPAPGKSTTSKSWQNPLTQLPSCQASEQASSLVHVAFEISVEPTVSASPPPGSRLSGSSKRRRNPTCSDALITGSVTVYAHSAIGATDSPVACDTIRPLAPLDPAESTVLSKQWAEVHARPVQPTSQRHVPSAWHNPWPQSVSVVHTASSPSKVAAKPERRPLLSAWNESDAVPSAPRGTTTVSCPSPVYVATISSPE